MFITYDGLLDPLGASQILPYIKGIAAAQGGVVVLSFEKSERYFRGQQAMMIDLQVHAIQWIPLRFTSGFGALGKVWDLLRMYSWGAWLSYRHDIGVIHARGHLAAQVGLFVKKLLGASLIFDCRGLWVDERVDKGGWDMRRLLHRMQYRYFKRVERGLFARADQVVVLTRKVINEVAKLGATPASKISVIPCCADFDHFPISTTERKNQARDSAGIPQNVYVLGYLGSVGRMYMLDRFFRLFELAASRHDCHALLVTQDIDALKNVMSRSLPALLHERVHIRSANRAEVPDVLPAMDVMVSFIQPSYARMATSPTKLAECYAEGIAVICNDGVGDVAEQIQQLGAGVIVDPASEVDLAEAVRRLNEIIAMGGQRLRDAARPLLGLEVAAASYQGVYSNLN